MKSYRSLVLLVSLAIGLSACGGASGSEPEDRGKVGDAALTIVFPPGSSSTTASVIQVRGTAEDPSQVTAISIGGALARSSDGWRTWTADVPLSLGENSLRARIVPVKAASLKTGQGPGSDSITIKREALDLRRPISMAFEPLSEKLYLLDNNGALSSFELNAGLWTLVSPAPQGERAFLSGDLVVDASGLKAYVSVAGEIQGIELTTGKRAEFPNATPSSMRTASGAPLALDAGRGLLYAAGLTGGEIIAINLSTADRHVLTSNTVGTGPSLSGARAFALDVAGDRLLVRRSNGVFQVDLGTGDRAALIGSGVLPFEAPLSLDLDPLNDRLLAGGPPASFVVAVPLGTGIAEQLSTDVLGTGAEPLWTAQTTFDGGSRYFSMDGQGRRVVMTDVTTGNRQLIYDSRIGSGPIGSPRDASLIPTAGQLLLATTPFEPGPQSLLFLDCATGRRTFYSEFDPLLFPFARIPMAIEGPDAAYVVPDGIPELRAYDLFAPKHGIIASASEGQGAAWGAAQDVLWDEDTGTVLVAQYAPPAILAVDPGNRARTALSDATLGTGASLGVPDRLSYDPVAQVIYVLDTSRLLRVDRQTGDRTVLVDSWGSSPTVGLVRPADVAYDAKSDHLYVALLGGEVGVAEVDVATGALTEVCGSTRGAGLRIHAPQALDVDPICGVLYLTDNARDVVVAIDPASGDRVTIVR